jgi:HemY protein
MWRIILYLVAIVAAAFLCIFVVEQHGLVSLTLGSNVYEIPLSLLLAALVVLTLALYLAYRLVKLVLLLPVSAFAGSRGRRKAKGHAAIAEGLVAVASGDFVAAQRHAEAAERLAGHEPLALLLKAQAAQLSGNRAAAKEAFARMTRMGDTRGLGLRGLFVEARRRGDSAEASRHAAQAAELDTFLPWAHEATLLAQCRARDWPAALATLERNHRLGAMGAGEMRRAKAALLAARALDLARSEPRQALQAAMKALSIDPGLVPAVTTAASLLGKDVRDRKAARIIETAWRTHPHPDLVEAYLSLEPQITAAEKAKRIAKLTTMAPEHEESRVALARALAVARRFDEARSALSALAVAKPTARVCLLLSEIEEAENGMTGLAREWLARAAHAPRDPAWIADGVISPHWLPMVPETGRIGIFTWAHPPDLIAAPSASVRLPIAAPPSRESLPPPRAALPVSATVIGTAPQIEVHSEPASVADGAAGPASLNGGQAPAEAGSSTPEARQSVGVVTDGDTSATSPTASEGAISTPPEARNKPVLPLERPPDDPGAEPAKTKGFWQRLAG